MTLLETVALAAWSPNLGTKNYIALGASGPAGDVQELSDSRELAIYAMGASRDGNGMRKVGRVSTDAYFRSIAWTDASASERSAGVIAGGMTDGTLCLWDALGVCGSKQRTAPLLYSRNIHSGQPVSCLEFNPQKPTLLGTGGFDGHVQVINIEHPERPEIYQGVSTTKHANSDVVCLSWNRKVQHIMSTASNQGTVVVWDLKSKKEVISFKDPGARTRCSALSWNPDVATQLLLAFNDDNNPCVQLWDMRNCSYPFKEFHEHTRGITSAAFCDSDANLFISSGRDNRTICWSLNSGQLEAYSELSLSSSASKLDWSPCMPGYVVASCSNGNVSVHSISQRQTAAAAKYTPKWMKVPCGVAFGFGGKMATFGSSQGSLVSLHVVPDEPQIVPEADKFESFLANDLRPFCESKRNEAFDEHDKLSWDLMLSLFDASTSRNRVLSAFGISASQVEEMTAKYLGRGPLRDSIPNPEHEQSHGGLANQPVNGFGESLELDANQLDNFFDQLAKDSEQKAQLQAAGSSRLESPTSEGTGLDLDVSPKADWSQGPESLIKHNMLIGNIPAAVDCCIKCGRFADALFLAASGGEELLTKTRKEYCRKQKDTFVKQLGYILNGDLEKVVMSSDLNEWVETLGMLVTYATNESFSQLVCLLGQRLEKERFDARSAVLCYLSCGSFDNTVRIWASMSNTETSQTDALQGLVEKMSCLFMAIRPSNADGVFTHKILQYATLLANSGRILAAMRCLVLIPDTKESLILKDRIYNASPALMSQLVRSKPQFPFDVSDVRPISSGPAPQLSQTSASRQGYSPSVGQGATSNPPYTAPQPAYGMGPYQTPTSPAIPKMASQVIPSAQMKGMGLAPNPINPHATPAGGYMAPHIAQAPMSQPSGQYGYQGSRPSTSFTQVPFQPPTPTTHAAIPRPTPVPQATQPSMPKAMTIPVRTQAPALGPVSATPVSSIPQRPAPQPAYAETHHVAAPLAPASGWSQQQHPMTQPRVTGPPTSGGVSTAPHATANPLTPGLPVSWPVPNSVQQELSHNVAVPLAKTAIPVQTGGDPMLSNDLAHVKRSLNALLERCAVDGNRRKWDDTAKRLNELYDKLSQGQVTKDACNKVMEICRAVDAHDFATASRLRVELSANDWERNRSWLFALQLLLPK